MLKKKLKENNLYINLNLINRLNFKHALENCRKETILNPNSELISQVQQRWSCYDHGMKDQLVSTFKKIGLFDKVVFKNAPKCSQTIFPVYFFSFLIRASIVGYTYLINF